jgi:Protein of unknown function DUF262
VANWFLGNVKPLKKRLLSVPKPTCLSGDEEDNNHRPWAYELCSIREGVHYAVDGTWSIPTFQRNFNWNPLGVRDLAESLWRDYPIGPLLIWERESDADAKHSPSLIIDGQHRLTALCMLFGYTPRWWSGEKTERWNDLASRYEVWFDMRAEREHFFWAATESSFDRENPRFVELSKLLSLDLHEQSGREELARIASQIDVNGAGRLDAEQQYARLLKVCAMKDQPMVATILHHPHLDDVLEIFARLNCQGIRFRRLLLSTAVHATARLWNW